MLVQQTGGARQHFLGGGITVRSAGGGAALTLLDDLVSYWKLDETSGTRNDAHGTNHLTDNNTVLFSASGKIGNAADLEFNNFEYFSIASNSTLQTGDVPFTFAGWLKIESLRNAVLVSKYKTTGNLREYLIFYNHNDHAPAANFSFIVSPDGTATNTVDATTFGAASVATWYFVVSWHDPVANTINIQINNGAVDSVSHTTGVATLTHDFQMGALSVTGIAYNFDGLLDEVGFWKRVLTADERTSLYNGGAGLAYPFS